MTANQTAIYVFTPQGLELGERLASALSACLFAAESLQSVGRAVTNVEVVYFSALPYLIEASFSRYAAHIFIGATGIAVRAIAPHLISKQRDPAVLVVDHLGKHVISLLSGHLGGANSLTRRVAAIIGGRAIITTATDCSRLPAIDELAKQHGLAIGNLKAAKVVSATLLAGDSVLLFDAENFLRLRGSEWHDLFVHCTELDIMPPLPLTVAIDGTSDPTPNEALFRTSPPSIVVTEKALPVLDGLQSRCLLLHPPVLCVGVGCKRNASGKAIFSAIAAVFEEQGLSLEALAYIASAEVKIDEPGLVTAAKHLGVPLRFYSAAELNAFPVSRPSAKAREVLGVDGVCEPAALAAARQPLPGRLPAEPRLLVEKRVRQGVTVAIALRSGIIV